MEYVRTKADKRAVEEGHYIDYEAVDRCIRFLESYVSLSTTNKPIKLQPFQRDFITQLIGWKKPNGKRRFTRCLLTSGKKSFGKTVLSAGLALYFLLADGVQSPLVILGATTREQATQLFKEAEFACNASEFLKARTDIKSSTHRILYPKKAGELKAISSEAPGKGGWNCSACILDEVALAPNANLYEMLKGSMKAREQPLLLCLSNAGYDKEHFYYRDIYKPAKDILLGESDETSLLPVIYEVPQEANWKDKSLWHLANPGLSTGLVSLDNYADEFNDATRNKSGEIWFRRFGLNQWTTAERAWIDLDEWDSCKGDFPSLENLPVFIAADMSLSHDLTSISAVYPHDGKFYVKSYNFVPSEAAKRRDKQNQRDYHLFALEGNLVIHQGSAIDYECVRNCIKAIPGIVQMVIFDRWNSAETSQALAKEGFNVWNFLQDHHQYNEPCRKFETLIKDRKIVHDGNSLLRWCINNTSLDTNARGLVKPVRSSDAYKIDACVSLLMALSQAVLYVDEPSYYETHGIQFLGGK